MAPRSPSRNQTSRKLQQTRPNGFRPPVRFAAALSAAAAVLIGGGCGGSSRARLAGDNVALGPVQLVPSLRVAGLVSRRLPPRWAVSFDVRGRVRIAFGLHRFEVRADGHVEQAGASATTLRFSGHGEIQSLIVTDTAYPASLLLHRLAELHARLARNAFPIGAGLDGRLHDSSSYWTSGFWPGALWQAASLEPAGGMFKRWALAATLAHLGNERADSHDVGFMYGQSSLAALEALCRLRATAPRSVCDRLRRSALRAADELLSLAAGNRRAGTIPTNSRGPQADTIVDSLMNAAALLPWASRVSGKHSYARLALRHAWRIAALLVRSDGSSAQAVNFDRRTGRILSIATHQGLSSASTWSRGQGWAVYGFAQLAAALRNRGLLRVAERTARYVAERLPAGGIPRWDYDAAAGAPVDVSAGVITAAGMFHLAAACHQMPGVCTDPARWIALGRRMLAAALSHASVRPPLGFLSSQVLNERAQGCWCNGGELILGLAYALEAVRLEASIG